MDLVPHNWSALITAIEEFHPKIYFFDIYCFARRDRKTWHRGLRYLRIIDGLISLTKVKDDLYQQLLYLLGPQRDDPLPMSTVFVGPSGVGKSTIAHAWMKILKIWNLVDNVRIKDGFKISFGMTAAVLGMETTAVLTDDERIRWIYRMDAYSSIELRDMFLQQLRIGLWKVCGKLLSRWFNHPVLLTGQGNAVEQLVLKCKTGWAALHWQSGVHPWQLDAAYVQSIISNCYARDEPPPYFI